MCTWKLDDDPDYTVYSTECQNMFMFEADGPVENNFNYCPYCGDVLHVKPTCEHEWVDARNAVVTSGEICKKCHAIRA